LAIGLTGEGPSLPRTLLSPGGFEVLSQMDVHAPVHVPGAPLIEDSGLKLTGFAEGQLPGADYRLSIGTFLDTHPAARCEINVEQGFRP
jgi:hypothetical protein